MNQLIQKRLFSKKVFIIEKATLNVVESTLFSKHERLIPIDEISMYWEKSEDKRDNVSIIIILFFLGIFVLAMGAEIETIVGYILVFIVLIALKRMFSSSFIFVKTKNNGRVVLYKKLPSIENVDSFLELLKNHQQQYLKWKYGTPDADLELDVQISNFRKLRNMGILSDLEYEQLKKDLKDLKGLNQ